MVLLALAAVPKANTDTQTADNTQLTGLRGMKRARREVKITFQSQITGNHSCGFVFANSNLTDYHQIIIIYHHMLPNPNTFPHFTIKPLARFHVLCRGTCGASKDTQEMQKLDWRFPWSQPTGIKKIAGKTSN